MKIFLIILLVVIIMLVALKIARQYREKFEFYDNLYKLLENMERNVSFKQENVVDVLPNKSNKTDFGKFINEFKRYLVSSECDFTDIKIIEENEKIILDEFVKTIGKSDVENELKNINYFKTDINEKRTETKYEFSRACPVILKLSFLFAVGVAIILI